MSKGVHPWPEGHQAWGRLVGWSLDTPDGALTALSDVGVIRRLLDLVEFDAVRTARKQGKSWSEIAIRLGVTRQSAWERWRDVDDADRVPLAISEAAAVARAEQVLGGAAEGITKSAARELRRRSVTVVPNVIGMSWNDARDALLRNGLVPTGSDPDGSPLGAPEWQDGVVTDQSPESGATVPPGSTVRLWLDKGGGSGVREPRRPKPDPKTGRKMWDEVTDEAVG